MTLANFYRRVLADLGVVAAEQNANPADREFVAERYLNVYEMLVTEGLIAWSKTDDIPDYAVVPLSTMVGSACAKGFGLVPDDIQSAIALLRRQLAKRYVSNPARTEYF